MKLPNQDLANVRLWAASLPFADESRASWIQRLCGDHQYNFSQLTSVAGFRPWMMDWDKALPISGWERLSRMAGMDSDDARYSTEWLTRIDRDTGGQGFLLERENKPSYRWCGECFQTDSTPYLRWYWRLAPVKECWKHGSLLSEECAVCGHSLFVDQSRLTRRCAMTLAECPRCGCTLTDREGDASRYDWHEQRRFRKAIALCWNFDLPEKADAMMGAGGIESKEVPGCSRWAHTPTTPSIGHRTEELPTKLADDLAGLLEASLSLVIPSAQLQGHSKAKAKRLAADDVARMKRFKKQYTLMIEEEGRVRQREALRLVDGIVPMVTGVDPGSIASRTVRLPWHWSLAVVQRMRLALSLREMRRTWRSIRAAAREARP